MTDPHDLIDCEYHFGIEEQMNDDQLLECISMGEFYAMLADIEHAIAVFPLEEAADEYYEKDFDLGESNEGF